MAKEKIEGDVKTKKEKKDKKEKRSEDDGVSKKSKKEKKQRKSKDPAEALLNQLENEPDSVAVTMNGDIPQTKFDEQHEDEIEPRRNIPPEALVPFANPLADDKQTKKIFKSVQKGERRNTSRLRCH
jgi:H/ACA ribonucleoprotein complex subunit 2